MNFNQQLTHFVTHLHDGTHLSVNEPISCQIARSLLQEIKFRREGERERGREMYRETTVNCKIRTSQALKGKFISLTQVLPLV